MDRQVSDLCIMIGLKLVWGEAFPQRCSLDPQGAVKDLCGNKCALMYGLFVSVSANIFCTFMTSMPNVIATLRAVEPVHRSLALGVESIVFRYVGERK